MIWLFKIDEVFWGDKPKVTEHYVFPDVDNIEFDITQYDISLYMATANYFLLNDTNPDEIYSLQYSGTNSNPSRLLVGKNTDYYNVVSNYYIDKTKLIIDIKLNKMEEFNKMDALKYLVKIGPEYTNEWTEAGMYNILCKVITSDEEIFTKNILDGLLKEATNY